MNWLRSPLNDYAHASNHWSTVNLSVPLKNATLTELCNINSVALVFLTDTWLYSETSNPETFLGSSLNIIARRDRDRSKHGGCLIAQCTKDPLNVLDISFPSFEFTVSCVVFSDTPSFFDLVYNPPSSSAYSIDMEELVKCLDTYFRKFFEVLRQFACSTNFNIYLLGDFNFPSIDWNTYSSSIASECQFMDFIVDHGLSQFVNEASHRNTNILDLVFSNQNVSVYNGKQLFCDHHPIFFNLDFVNFKLQSHGSSSSKSSFNNQIFITYLNGLFELMSTDNSLNPHYPD